MTDCRKEREHMKCDSEHDGSEIRLCIWGNRREEILKYRGS